MIAGVITAENDAIEHYNAIVRFCDGTDPVTQDLVIGILADEERHRMTEGSSCRHCGARRELVVDPLEPLAPHAAEVERVARERLHPSQRTSIEASRRSLRRGGLETVTTSLPRA